MNNRIYNVIKNIESILPSPLWDNLVAGTTLEPDGSEFKWDAGLSVQVYRLEVRNNANEVMANTKLLKLRYTDEYAMRQAFGEKLNANPILLIKMIEVEPKYRRQGIGAYMVEYILNAFKELGDYKDMLFWGELYEDGRRLKQQFDRKYGINVIDEKRRLSKGQRATESYGPVWDESSLAPTIISQDTVSNDGDTSTALELEISVAGEPAGQIDFSLLEYPDASRNYVVINWINVYPQFKRMGLATFMIEYLINNYVPYSDIYWHYLLSDGKALKAKLDAKYGKNVNDSEWRRQQSKEETNFDYTE